MECKTQVLSQCPQNSCDPSCHLYMMEVRCQHMRWTSVKWKRTFIPQIFPDLVALLKNFFCFFFFVFYFIWENRVINYYVKNMGLQKKATMLKIKKKNICRKMDFDSCVEKNLPEWF